MQWFMSLLPPCPFQIDVYQPAGMTTVYVRLRPHVEAFLQAVAKVRRRVGGRGSLALNPPCFPLLSTTRSCSSRPRRSCMLMHL